jgi:putative tricarboxylic transport membrane protein
MEVLNHLAYGFSISFLPINLLHCFVGVMVGTLVGVLPGLGPVAAISLLLPMTLRVSDPISGLIMLAGVYYGSAYGGSTTSILVNIPGEAASVVTCLDGHQMALKGRAGPALGISAFGSFIAGCIGIVGLTLVAPPLANIALRFGPPEYAALMFLGLTILSYIASGSMIKAFMMAGFGLILGTVGMDIVTANYRFTYGIMSLEDGLGLVPMVMGFFGITEVLLNVENWANTTVVSGKIKGLFPNLADWKRCGWPIGRGTLIGFFLGILPGAGPVIASFLSYIVEKKISKEPGAFGQGAIEGVAAPEAANNAAAQSAFIPMLTLGIPSTATMAIMLGALIIYGVEPGPFLLQKRPDLFWGVVTSMFTGNAMLLVLNLPLIPMWVRILKIPYVYLFPMILLFCMIGAYSINNSVMDIVVMNIFGLLGYFLKKTNYEGAPMILALVLGPMFENSLRLSLVISKGSFLIFFTRPISIAFIAAAFLVLISPYIFGKKKPVLPDAGDT